MAAAQRRRRWFNPTRVESKVCARLPPHQINHPPNKRFPVGLVPSSVFYLAGLVSKQNDRLADPMKSNNRAKQLDRFRWWAATDKTSSSNFAIG